MEAAFWSSQCVLNSLKNVGVSDLKLPVTKLPFNGLTIPAYGPACRNGAIVMAVSNEHQILQKEDICTLRWLSQRTHEAHCKLLRENKLHVPRVSTREKQVLAQLARGKSNKEVARALEISPHTVNGHIQRIFLKFGTDDRMTAVMRGIKAGAIAL